MRCIFDGCTNEAKAIYGGDLLCEKHIKQKKLITETIPNAFLIISIVIYIISINVISLLPSK